MLNKTDEINLSSPRTITHPLLKYSSQVCSLHWKNTKKGRNPPRE